MKTALHPSRPIVSYSSGCRITVFDMLTDQKFDLVRHEHEIQELTFTPPGFGNKYQSGQGGEYLVSIDFNRNEVANTDLLGQSKMCIWDWQKG